MDYIVYSHNDSFIYVSKINGNQIILKKDIPQDSKIFKTASIESMMNIPINYNQVLNEYSSVVDYISKEEIFDEILYSTPGKYKVKVGIRDAANRLRTQEFMVTVSPC